MTPRDFLIWSKQQIKRLENENESRDYNTAVLMAHMANIWCNKKGSKFKPEDFIKKKKKKSNKPMSANVMAEVFKAITIANGGDIN